MTDTIHSHPAELYRVYFNDSEKMPVDVRLIPHDSDSDMPRYEIRPTINSKPSIISADDISRIQPIRFMTYYHETTFGGYSRSDIRKHNIKMLRTTLEFYDRGPADLEFLSNKIFWWDMIVEVYVLDVHTVVRTQIPNELAYYYEKDTYTAYYVLSETTPTAYPDLSTAMLKFFVARL